METEPATNIGFIIRRHPTATWKETLVEEVKNQLVLSMKKLGQTDEIPEFALYHGRKSFGAGQSRVHAMVIYVQCKENDAGRLKGLLGAGRATQGWFLFLQVSISPRIRNA